MQEHSPHRQSLSTPVSGGRVSQKSFENLTRKSYQLWLPIAELHNIGFLVHFDDIWISHTLAQVDSATRIEGWPGHRHSTGRTRVPEKRSPLALYRGNDGVIDCRQQKTHLKVSEGGSRQRILPFLPHVPQLLAHNNPPSAADLAGTSFVHFLVQDTRKRHQDVVPFVPATCLANDQQFRYILFFALRSPFAPLYAPNIWSRIHLCSELQDVKASMLEA